MGTFCATAAEQLGLPATTFWPPGIAGVIAAQQAALSEQLQALHTNATFARDTPVRTGSPIAVMSPGPELAAPGLPGPGSAMPGTATQPWASGSLPQPGVTHRELLTGSDALGIPLASGVTGKKTLATAASYVTAVPTADSGTAVDGSVHGFDPTRPGAARVYDYFLGGKTHFAADRETAETVLSSAPNIVRTAARENRAFLGRAVRYLVAEAGIRQFLDIGTGLPTANNVHEVAQALEPSARVVYADNDRCKSSCAHAHWAGQATSSKPRHENTSRGESDAGHMPVLGYPALRNQPKTGA